MEMARDTGQPTATCRLALRVGDANKNKDGFIIYLPVYRPAGVHLDHQRSSRPRSKDSFCKF